VDRAAARGKPSSDVAIHRAIYEARADVLAVVHAHLPASMALTLAGEIPDPTALPETALFLPRLPFVPFAAMGSAELAAAVAAAFAGEPDPLPGAVLLERHGAVAVGRSLDEAVDRLDLVEVLCRTWTDALLIRAAVTRADGRAILRASSPRPGTPIRGSSRRDR
jgi:L-fuculose-phosphate aldolase